MYVIRRADYKSMRWKNGAGSTTQIAIFPADSTTDNFEWRISMAVVNTNGSFSTFAGIERTIIVLEGAGINLFIEGRSPERIEAGSAPFTFAADARTDAKLIDGVILDLNIMARRDRFNHCVWRLSKPVEWVSTDTIVLFAQNTGLHIQRGAQSTRIELGNTAILDNIQSFEITPDSQANYYLVEFIKI